MVAGDEWQILHEADDAVLVVIEGAARLAAAEIAYVDIILRALSGYSQGSRQHGFFVREWGRWLCGGGENIGVCDGEVVFSCYGWQ